MALPSIRPLLKQKVMLHKRVVVDTQIVDGSEITYDDGVEFRTYSKAIVKSYDHNEKKAVNNLSTRFYFDKTFDGLNGDKLVFKGVEYIVDIVNDYPDYPNADIIHHFEVDVIG